MLNQKRGYYDKIVTVCVMCVVRACVCVCVWWCVGMCVRVRTKKKKKKKKKKNALAQVRSGSLVKIV